jgi:muramoyltetrapeptide carboxypeptidase
MGHSDFTAINMALLAHGAISFTGPMLSSDFGLENMSQFTLENFVTILLNPQYCIRVHAQNEVCAVEGTLWGGNLAMINSLLGTPYFPKIKEGILFLEDINEHPYKIERMLLQLLSAGILQQQKAIVLGDFSEYKLTEYDRGYNFDTMLSFVRSKVKVPILIGLPFGHIVNKLTLPIGAKAKLSSTGNAFELQLSGYPYLSV